MTKLRKDEYLNLERAAKLLGVTFRTLKRIMADGAIPYRQLGPRTYRISRAELEQYMRRRSYPLRQEPDLKGTEIERVY